MYISSAPGSPARRATSTLLLLFLFVPIAAWSGLTATTTPDPVPFDDTRVGETSGGETVTITNTSGGVPITVDSISFSGTNSGDFAVDAGADNCTGQAIAAGGGTCTFDITFTPGAAGARTASVDFTTSPVDGIVPSATLNGTGTEPAVGLDTASPLDMGSEDVGATTAASTVTLENTGTADLNLGQLDVSGTNEDDFTLGGDNCSGQVLTPAATCTFQITFTPSAPGTRDAQVDIPSDAPTSPDVLGLTGTGIVVGPAVDLTPVSIDFGGHDVGVPSSATQVTLENIGNQTLNVGTLGVSGANSVDFVLGNDTCSSQAIDAGNTCTFGVTFTPGAAGARSAQVDVPSDAPTSPDAVALSGSGNGDADVSVDPTSINFGGQPVGVTSSAQTVTYANNGDVGVNVGTITIGAGAKGSDFALVNDNCSGQTVGASSSCTFGVTFTPASAGASSGSVSIPSDAPDAPHSVALSGNGLSGDGDFFIDSSMSGSFGDPAFNGQGVNIEIIVPQTATEKGGIAGLAVVYWYSYGTDGFPFFAFGVGNVVGDQIIINMLWDPTGGPEFGPLWMPSDFEPGFFSQVLITALDCNTLLFEFEDAPDGLTEHQMVMDRITEVVGLSCFDNRKGLVQRRVEPLDKGGITTVATRSGSFYDPSFNGQGINTEVLSFATKGASITGSVLIYWYSFDNSGQPFFAFGVGNYANDRMTARMLIDYDGNGPFFGPGWNTADFTPGDFADIVILWDGCDEATMTFQMLGDFTGGWQPHPMELERITALAGQVCF